MIVMIIMITLANVDPFSKFFHQLIRKIMSPPQREKTCPGPMCTIMQNFTPIGAIVAEISVTGRRKQVRQQDTNPPYGDGQLKVKLCVTPYPPPFQGMVTSFTVANCMLLSSVLKRVKTRGGV